MSHIATAQLLFKHQLSRLVKFDWLMFSDKIWLVACRWSHRMPSGHLLQSLSHFCAKLQLSNCIRPWAVSADVKTSLLDASVDVRSFVELRFWLESFLRSLDIIQTVGVIIIFPFQGLTMVVWWSSVIISCMLLRLRRRLALVLTQFERNEIFRIFNVVGWGPTPFTNANCFCTAYNVNVNEWSIWVIISNLPYGSMNGRWNGSDMSKGGGIGGWKI